MIDPKLKLDNVRCIICGWVLNLKKIWYDLIGKYSVTNITCPECHSKFEVLQENGNLSMIKYE